MSTTMMANRAKQNFLLLDENFSSQTARCSAFWLAVSPTFPTFN